MRTDDERRAMYRAGIHSYEPPDNEPAHLDATETANCTLCNDDGYRGTVVCDHIDHTPAATRGRALVQAELDKAKAKRAAS